MQIVVYPDGTTIILMMVTLIFICDNGVDDVAAMSDGVGIRLWSRNCRSIFSVVTMAARSYEQLLLLPRLIYEILTENITERETYAWGRAVLQEPGRDAFQGENGEECDVELELAEKHYCNYLQMAICKNIFSEGEYSMWASGTRIRFTSGTQRCTRVSIGLSLGNSVGTTVGSSHNLRSKSTTVN